MSSHDPGDLYDPPPRRRREYRQEDEFDGAWAAGDEANIENPGMGTEDPVIGIRQPNRDPYSAEPEPAQDLGPLPPLPPRRTPVRRIITPAALPYAGDPRRLSGPDTRHDLPHRPSFHMPCWLVLLLVVLGVLALFACVLAVASVLML